MVTLVYCLMTNHVHLGSMPFQADTLARVMKPVDLRYVQHINWNQGISGACGKGGFSLVRWTRSVCRRRYDMLNATRFGLGW